VKPNRLLVFLLLSVAALVPRSAAQISAASRGNLKVRLFFTDGHPCTLRVQVQLMISASTSPTGEQYTNDEGTASFDGIEVGNYHVVVSGDGIQQTDSGLFQVDARKGTQHLDLTVKRTDEGKAKMPVAPTVSAMDLNVPKKAQKEFDQANESIAQQDWKKALEQLNKAVEAYPNYVAAYNNLAVVYARLGDRQDERQALQKAVSLDAHFAPAFANLGKMAITDHNYPEAETYLSKANAADPNDSQTLVLLAQVELLDQHYDEAIAHCHQAHSTSQAHALAHYIAARAFEHENRPGDAISELQTFLEEEPSGGRADAVRKEVAGLQNHVQ
jgi:tetratricopeptide (TPR) repeat protein